MFVNFQLGILKLFKKKDHYVFFLIFIKSKTRSKWGALYILTCEQLFSIWAIFYRRPRPFLSPIDQCWCKKFQPHEKLTTFCSWTCHQHVKFAFCMGVLGWSHSLCGLRSHQLFWVKAQKRASLLSSNNPCTQIPRVHSRHRRLCQLFTLCWWEEELLCARAWPCRSREQSDGENMKLCCSWDL